MNNPGTITLDDNQQLVACHIQNARQLLGNLAAANLTSQPADVLSYVPNIITELQKIDTLAAQQLGAQHRDARRNQDSC